MNDDLLKGDLETVPTDKPDKKDNGGVNSSSRDLNTFDLSAEQLDSDLSFTGMEDAQVQSNEKTKAYSQKRKYDRRIAKMVGH